MAVSMPGEGRRNGGSGTEPSGEAAGFSRKPRGRARSARRPCSQRAPAQARHIERPHGGPQRSGAVSYSGYRRGHQIHAPVAAIYQAGFAIGFLLLFAGTASMALARRSMICTGVAEDSTVPALVSTLERKVCLRV